MQAPSEADVARKEALLRRASEHAAWKASFFPSRPTPPYLFKSRPRREPICAAPTHALMKRAREIVAAEGPLSLSAPSPLNADGAENNSDFELSDAIALSGPARRQAAWRRQMRIERERRNPYTDAKILSAPSRTVIVAGLHAKAVEEDVRLFGEQFGRVVSARLVRDRAGRSRRYGFVQFGLEAEARRAAAQSRRRRLHGRLVVVDMERGRTESAFLPARLAQAQRMERQRSSGGGAAGKDKEREEEKARKVTLDTDVDSAHAKARDEVDELLDDIMNIT